MFELKIKKSKSKNFSEALKCAIKLGGTFDGENISIKVNQKLSIYDTLFPILKYNVTNWKGTRAFYNGLEVDPYKFMLDKHLTVKQTVSEIMNQINDSETISYDFTYYKREENTFYFKNVNSDYKFDITLTGKQLYLFVEKYNLNDLISLKEFNFY